MIRTTLIALTAALTLGSASASFAGQVFDGDNNAVPGALVNRPASDLERSFAGPRRPAPVWVEDKAFFDRHTQID
jgi:hypothetical protein